MSKLIILCGPAGCGKSTWAKSYIAKHKDAKWISRDAVRFSMVKENEKYFSKEDDVYAEFCKLISEALASGKTAIADATHLTERARNLLINTITFPIKDKDITIVDFWVPLDKVLAQNAQRTGRAYVPDEVIRRMWFQHTDPNNDMRCYGEYILIE